VKLQKVPGKHRVNITGTALGRAHGSMFADDRPQTTRTAGRHAMIGGESVSWTSPHTFARIARRNISDRISACSHGLSRLSRRTDIRFATQPYIPITHHLLLHPCPSCRTPIIYNTPPYALSVHCAMSRISHTAPYPTSSHPLRHCPYGQELSLASLLLTIAPCALH